MILRIYLDPILLPIITGFSTAYLLLLFIRMSIRFLFQTRDIEKARRDFIQAVLMPLTIEVDKNNSNKYIEKIAISLLLLLAILSIPGIRGVIISNFFSQDFILFLKDKKDIFASIFESSIILLEILILIFVGDFIFTNSIADSFRGSCLEYQDKINASCEKNADELEDLLDESSVDALLSFRGYLDCLTDITKSKNFFEYLKKIKKAFDLAKKFNRSYSLFLSHGLLNEVPLRYRDYVVAVFYSSFPGGIYGVIIFSLFSCTLAFKVLKLYLESPLLN